MEMPERKEERLGPWGRTDVKGRECFQEGEMDSVLCLLTEMEGLKMGVRWIRWSLDLIYETVRINTLGIQIGE